MDMPKSFAGRFAVVEEIAKRPNCLVYKGTDSRLGREVAIKLFLDRPFNDAQTISQFQDEVASLRRASHEVLVPIIAGDCENDWFYLAMEYITGGTLRDLLNSSKEPLAAEQAVQIVSELGAGLKELHESGNVHGHIDSRAVLFKENHVRLAGYYPRVIGNIQKSRSSDGRMVIEAAYIAPEQITSSEYDARADIFALSVLMFEMLTGKRPFLAPNPLQMAMLRLTNEPPSPAKINPDIPPLLDAAIIKGLARDPRERYARVGDFVQAIIGGRKPPGKIFSRSSEEGAGQGFGTQTIGVSMSTETIRDLLRAHDTSAPMPAEPASKQAFPAETGVMETMAGKPVYVSELIAGQYEHRGPAGKKITQEVHGLPGFMMINGEQRGQRFEISRNSLIIGSDSSCEMPLVGKGIPARYAIVSSKNGQNFVGALSSAGIVLNGEQKEGGEDFLLKRGDVLSVGPHKLRYVEAKEVFTLQEEASDRVMDRPASVLPKILGIGAAAAVICCLIVFGAWKINYKKSVQARQLRQAREAQETKDLVSRLKSEGDEFFKAGQLISPPEACAKIRFEQVLDLDADDSYAKRRLREVEERIRNIASQEERKQMQVQQVEELLAQGDRFFTSERYVSPPGANAKETYTAVLRADPNNAHAKEKIAEIDKLLGDMVGKINQLIAQAKQYRASGQFVLPRGENAYDSLEQVLSLDPGNVEAKNLLYSMAAQSIVQGDQAKSAADVAKMRRSYLVAQALGVDPAFLQPRMKGADLIRKSRSEMIFVDHQGKKDDAVEKRPANSKYLDTGEVERRMAEYQIPEALTTPTKGRKFVDVNSIR